MFQRLFNEVNRKITGENVVVDSGAPWGIRYRLDMDSWGVAGAASRTIVTGDGPARQTDPSWEATRLGHINRKGLTQAGRILFDELARPVAGISPGWVALLAGLYVLAYPLGLLGASGFNLLHRRTAFVVANNLPSGASTWMSRRTRTTGPSSARMLSQASVRTR